MSMRLLPASVFATLLLVTQFAPAAAPPCASGDRCSKAEQLIKRRLATPVSVEFNGATLKSVIEELEDVNGINIDIDDPALQEAGISLESPITVKLDSVSLKSALNNILHQVHLTYRIRDERVQITTEWEAKRTVVSASYPVTDLIGRLVVSAQEPKLLGKPGNIIKDEALVNLITSTISPHSWTTMGGPGTIDYYPLAKTLVIHQTPDIQEQVADLLAALRQLFENSDEQKPCRTDP